MSKIKTLLAFFLIVGTTLAQERKTYKIRTIAFYNLENLFDTLDNPETFDDDRTPEGKDLWTQERYKRKVDHMSKVLSEIGSETSKTSPDIIGICEVENRQVVEDLVHHPYLRDKDYGIIHFDSPDERGIDVALLYKKESYIPSSFSSHRLLLYNSEDFRDYTRDQLVVGGYMDGEEIHFIVNHWPSRSGGEARSKPYRIAAAKLNRRIIDSILDISPKAKIIAMGDLNDDPLDDSLKKVLKTKGKQPSLTRDALYNPMENLYKKGWGSLAYRDQWNLFDQIYLTANFVLNSYEGFHYWKAGIFSPSYLLDQDGKYKGYPLRTYAGGSYIGGYSDHFPVYIYVIKEAK